MQPMRRPLASRKPRMILTNRSWSNFSSSWTFEKDAKKTLFAVPDSVWTG